jgi:hypothetical protein
MSKFTIIVTRDGRYLFCEPLKGYFANGQIWGYKIIDRAKLSYQERYKEYVEATYLDWKLENFQFTNNNCVDGHNKLTEIPEWIDEDAVKNNCDDLFKKIVLIYLQHKKLWALIVDKIGTCYFLSNRNRILKHENKMNKIWYYYHYNKGLQYFRLPTSLTYEYISRLAKIFKIKLPNNFFTKIFDFARNINFKIMIHNWKTYDNLCKKEGKKFDKKERVFFNQYSKLRIFFEELFYKYMVYRMSKIQGFVAENNKPKNCSVYDEYEDEYQEEDLHDVYDDDNEQQFEIP